MPTAARRRGRRHPRRRPDDLGWLATGSTPSTSCGRAARSRRSVVPQGRGERCPAFGGRSTACGRGSTASSRTGPPVRAALGGDEDQCRAAADPLKEPAASIDWNRRDPAEPGRDAADRTAVGLRQGPSRPVAHPSRGPQRGLRRPRLDAAPARHGRPAGRIDAAHGWRHHGRGIRPDRDPQPEERPSAALATFDLTDSAEDADQCPGPPVALYHKSLLYMVARSLERDGPYGRDANGNPLAEVPMVGLSKYLPMTVKLPNGTTGALRDLIGGPGQLRHRAEPRAGGRGPLRGARARRLRRRSRHPDGDPAPDAGAVPDRAGPAVSQGRVADRGRPRRGERDPRGRGALGRRVVRRPEPGRRRRSHGRRPGPVPAGGGRDVTDPGGHRRPVRPRARAVGLPAGGRAGSTAAGQGPAATRPPRPRRVDPHRPTGWDVRPAIVRTWMPPSSPLGPSRRRRRHRSSPAGSAGAAIGPRTRSRRGSSASAPTALIDDQLLLLEHDGGPDPRPEQRRGPRPAHPEASSSARGIEVVRVERGGEVTYHGPGQLVAYPIIALARARPARCGRSSGRSRRRSSRRAPRLGVDGRPARRPSRAAGAIRTVRPRARSARSGLRIERGVSYHGIALNVTVDLATSS